MQKITPCLWFDNQAEEAVKFYVSIFENSKIGATILYLGRVKYPAKTTPCGKGS
jgi:predicted 3-demethylubiquinone-9 3-methyltransferase (glyoxalase superfamily)